MTSVQNGSTKNPLVLAGNRGSSSMTERHNVPGPPNYVRRDYDKQAATPKPSVEIDLVSDRGSVTATSSLTTEP